MNWILIAIISGMISVSSYETEEGCLGKKAILEKNKITTNSKCVDMISGSLFLGTSGSYTTICPSSGLNCR